MSKESLTLALEKIADALPAYIDGVVAREYLATIHESLTEQPRQEPVAVHQFRSPYCSDWYDGVPDHHDGHGPYEVRTLYTTPPQRKPLTDDEIEEVWKRVQANDFHDCVQPFARAIEAKLKEPTKSNFQRTAEWLKACVQPFVRAIETKLKEKNL